MNYYYFAANNTVMRFLFLLLFTCSCLSCLASSTEGAPSGFPAPFFVTSPLLTIRDFTSMKIKDIEKLTGKKFSLVEKIAVQLLQRKLKKQITLGQDPEKLRKMGTLSLLLGVTSILVLFLPYGIIASIALSIAGLVLGIKATKGGKNINAILGIIFSSVTLAFILLAIVVLASWRWNN